MEDNITALTTLSPVDMMGILSSNDSDQNFGQGFCDYTSDSLSWPSIFILIVTILGLIGNSCLLFVILRRRYLHNLTNILVVNLAASDILLFITTVPFFVEIDIHPCWQFGTAVCKLANTIWIVSHSVCMFTLAALAIERYCAVTSRAGFRSKTCALVSIWLFAAVLALPVLITAHMPYEGVCIGLARSIKFVQAYITCHVIFTFIIPLVIIAVFYIRMARTLLGGNSRSMEVGNGKNKGFRKRRRLAAIVLVLVLIFAFFWTPFHGFNLLVVYGAFWSIPWKIGKIIFILHYVLIYIYLFLNPLVIFLMSSSLRRELISCRRRESRGMKEIVTDDSQSDISDVDLELQQPINDEPDNLLKEDS